MSTTLTIAYLILSFGVHIYCRDAIQFFLKNKKVEYVNITVLRNTDNSTKKWVEYKYVFKNHENILQTPQNLKIGVFASSDNKFDCQMMTDEKNNTVIKGYSVDIIMNLQESLNISSDFSVINNSTALHTGTVDLIVCNYYNIEHVDSNITQLFPALKTNVVFIYKPSKLNFTKDIFILTFAGSLWLVFFTILILLAICLRISTVQYSRFHTKYSPWTWVEITLWAIAAACQQGLSNTPKGFVSCCVFLMGYIMSYLLYTGFAAAITSILVQHDEEMNTQLKNVKFSKLYLVSSQYTTFHTEYFKNEFLKTEMVDSFDVLFEHLDKDYRVGIGPEILLQQYMAQQFNTEQISAFRTLKLNVVYTRGFLILRDSPWKERINRKLIEMNELGILKNMLEKNLRLTKTIGLSSDYSSAGWEHVGSAILLFLGGALMSTLFLMAEFMLYFYQRGRNRVGL